MTPTKQKQRTTICAAKFKIYGRKMEVREDALQRKHVDELLSFAT